MRQSVDVGQGHLLRCADRWPDDPGEQIDLLIEQMSDMSEQELMDQVYRRLTIHLCGDCYRQWMDNPAG